MNSSLPRIGLIGLGGFAQSHLGRLHTLQAGGLCRLVAAADPFAERHAAVVAALEAEGTVVRDGLESLLASDDVDALFIATPISLHAPQTILALEAGKHVYLEKPPCATLGEWKSMHAAWEKTGLVCVVGYQMQSHPAMRYVQRLVADGSLGTLRRVWGAVRWRRADLYYNRSPWVARWYQEGQPVFDGPATNALAHVVHAALGIAASASGNSLELAKMRGTFLRARPVDSYDTVLLEAQSASGVELRVAFTHATLQHDDVELSIQGDKGLVVLSWKGEVRVKMNGEPEQLLRFPSDTNTIAALDFLRAIQDSTFRPPVTLQDTLPYVQWANGALLSSEGASDLPADLVSKVEHHGEGVYVVEGLDEQFAAFRGNYDAPAPLLSLEGKRWVTPAEVPDILPCVS